MMKNTQKKLKAKHFRYLSKVYVKDPLAYLDQLYTTETDFKSLRTKIDSFLQTGLDPRLKIKGFNYSYIGHQFIKLIEIAHIFYTNICSLGLQTKRPKFKNGKEMYQYSHREQGDPVYALQCFFGLMSVKGWREEVDYITSIACDELKEIYFELHEDAMLIYTYGIQMTDALHQIHINGGIDLELPTYLFPKGRAEPNMATPKNL